MLEGKTLKQQFQSMNTGDVIVTNANRATVFVNAKRAGWRVSTVKDGDSLKVTLLEKIAVTPKPKISQFDSVLNIVKEWTVETRLKLFGEFELCCGMNRGSCICPDEEISVAQPFAPVASGDPLTDFIAKARAKKGIIQPTIDDVDPAFDEWVFTSDKARQDEQTGDWHRPQYLESNPKKKRTVQVDEFNHDEIVMVI